MVQPQSKRPLQLNPEKHKDAESLLRIGNRAATPTRTSTVRQEQANVTSTEITPANHVDEDDFRAACVRENKRLMATTSAIAATMEAVIRLLRGGLRSGAVGRMPRWISRSTWPMTS